MSSPPRRVRVAAYALCLDDEGRILLCRVAPSLSADRSWMLPGGGVEFGEDPAATVLRELAEETGLTGRIVGIAAIVSRLLDRRSWADGADVHNVAILYRVEAEPGELRDEIGGTTDTCAWLTRAQAEARPLWQLARDGIGLAYGDGAAER